MAGEDIRKKGLPKVPTRWVVFFLFGKCRVQTRFLVETFDSLPPQKKVVFPKIGENPQIMNSNGFFAHYKPIHFGIPLFFGNT